MINFIGLGGRRARYTSGELWWCVALSAGGGSLIGMAITMALVN
jgi:hypothetical protein